MVSEVVIDLKAYAYFTFLFFFFENEIFAKIIYRKKIPSIGLG